MPIFMEILQTVIKRNLHEVGKTWFLVIPCIGQRKYSVSEATGVHPVSQFPNLFWTENEAQLSLFLHYNVQLAIILFNRTWPIYLCIYGFPVVWINFPKYLNECCSPSSFCLVETLWSPKTMLLIKFSEIWWSQSHFVYVFYEKHVLLDVFEQQTGNWYFHEKSPHKVPYTPTPHPLRSMTTPI